MIPIKVDIVGGSLAGLSTAISIKEHDPSIDVTVHEKYRTIGYNHEGRRCGEAHTVEREWSKWKPAGYSVFAQITHGTLSIGTHQYTSTKPPGVGYILNRQEFICQLARDAEKNHVVLSTDDRVASVDDLDGNYIVDASGCPSTLKRELGFKTKYAGTTYQQTLQDANCFTTDAIQVFFMKNMGYYWIFPRDPKKHEMNIGIGMLGKFRCNLKELLEAFKEEHHITGTVSYVVGGLVPLGLQRPLMYKNIFFVGDAGVGTFPLLGQGIYRALMSGDIAGKCIGLKQPNRYPSLIRYEFLRWDLIGMSFIKVNAVLQHAAPVVFLPSMNLLGKVWLRNNLIPL